MPSSVSGWPFPNVDLKSILFYIQVKFNFHVACQPTISGHCGCLIFEPTCAFCTVGSYVSLPVCPSVCLSVRLYGLGQKSDWTIIHTCISESILSHVKVFCHMYKLTGYCILNNYFNMSTCKPYQSSA